MLTSAVQKSDSSYIHILSNILFHYGLSHILNIVPSQLYSRTFLFIHSIVTVCISWLKLPLHDSSISPPLATESLETLISMIPGTWHCTDNGWLFESIILNLDPKGLQEEKRRCKTGISRVLFLGCSFDSWIFPLRKEHQRHTQKQNKNLWVSRFPWDYSNMCFFPLKAILSEWHHHLPEKRHSIV